MTEQPRVTITTSDGVADVRLNRADKMNALDPAMFTAIIDAIAQIGADAAVRCVVLSGAGRAFCAGLDMASMGAVGSGTGDLMDRTAGPANDFQQVAWGWRALPQPVIVAAHGICFGGGMQIASGADVRIMAPDTRCAIMEARWGLVPDMAGYALWRGQVRDDVLRELAYSAREFSGTEAVAHGLATRVADDPLAAALALAHEIAHKNPDAVRGMKRLSNAMYDADAPALLLAESAEQAAIIRTPNQMEAVAANFAKRAAVFVDAP